MLNSSSAFHCHPIPEPSNDDAVPSPVPMMIKDFSFGSIPMPISSSPPSPNKNILSHIKGKVPCPSVTPVNSPTSSPINQIDSDLDFLLSRKSLELEPLTIHKPRFQASPLISPDSAKNITVWKKSRGGNTHFRGRTTITKSRVGNLSLTEVHIYGLLDPQPLRAKAAGESSK